MSNLDKLGRRVQQRIKIRGRDYFARNAVRILFADPDFVSAKVTGSQIYEVDLERDGRLLIFSCDCPYFDDHQEVCKHVWATLLELEKSGHFAKWGSTFPVELVPTDSDGDLDDEYIDDLDLEEEDELFIDPESWKPTQQEENHRECRHTHRQAQPLHH